MRLRNTGFWRGLLGASSGMAAWFAVTSPVALQAIGTLPGISVLTPLPNQTVAGQVTFYAAADSSGVAGLRFQVDGQDVGPEITSGSCSLGWSSTTAADGLHTVQAVGRDQYGNALNSQAVNILVSNLSPTPTPAPTPTPTASPTPASVTVISSTVYEGQTAQAVARDANGNVLTGVLWSVEHSFMAAIDYTGHITQTQLSGPVAGRASADVGIFATLNGVTRGALLTVQAGPAPSPTPSPTPTPTPTPTPAPTPTPTEPPQLVIGLAVSGGQAFTLTATVTKGGLPLAGAATGFVMLGPTGNLTAYSAKTNAFGVASVKAKLSSKDRGIYTVSATATYGGLTASTSASLRR